VKGPAVKELLLLLIHYGSQFVWAVIIADVALSWIVMVQRPRWVYHPLVRWVQNTAFQILRPFRQLLGSLGAGRMPIDISPILAMFAIQIVERVLIRLILLLPIP